MASGIKRLAAARGQDMAKFIGNLGAGKAPKKMPKQMVKKPPRKGK